MEIEEKLDRAETVASHVHAATTTLAGDFGILEGIKNTVGLRKQTLCGPTDLALYTIQAALYRSIILQIRVLFETGNRKDDASFIVLKRFAEDRNTIDELISSISRIALADFASALDQLTNTEKSIDQILKKFTNYTNKKIAHSTTQKNLIIPNFADARAMLEKAIELDQYSRSAFCIKEPLDLDIETYRKKNFESGVILAETLIESEKQSQPSP